LNRATVIILAIAVGFLLFDKFVMAPRATVSEPPAGNSADEVRVTAGRTAY
jgi:hypothetical protein